MTPTKEPEERTLPKCGLCKADALVTNTGMVKCPNSWPDCRLGKVYFSEEDWHTLMAEQPEVEVPEPREISPHPLSQEWSDSLQPEPKLKEVIAEIKANGYADSHGPYYANLIQTDDVESILRTNWPKAEGYTEDDMRKAYFWEPHTEVGKGKTFEELLKSITKTTDK